MTYLQKPAHGSTGHLGAVYLPPIELVPLGYWGQQDDRSGALLSVGLRSVAQQLEESR